MGRPIGLLALLDEESQFPKVTSSNIKPLQNIILFWPIQLERFIALQLPQLISK